MYALQQDNQLSVSNLSSFYTSIVRANHPLFLQMSCAFSNTLEPSVTNNVLEDLQVRLDFLTSATFLHMHQQPRKKLTKDYLPHKHENRLITTPFAHWSLIRHYSLLFWTITSFFRMQPQAVYISEWKSEEEENGEGSVV